MQRHKHRRIFYPKGFISLMVLPWLCLWYLKDEKRLVFRAPRAMEIVLPDVSAEPEMFSIFNFPKRKNHTITLTGNNKEDKIKLDYIQLELKRIVKENDSIHGVHVVFTDSAKYWSMIKLFDICNIENITRYILHDNDFFAAHASNNYDTTIHYRPICGGVFNSETQEEEKSKKELEKHKIIEKRKNIFSALWPSGLLFFSLIFLSFRQLYSFGSKTHNRRTYKNT